MSCNYKVKIKDIQNKYKFKIFCASNYDDSEIKKMYETIYMALPKEKASGTSITLNDTAKSYMKNELYATETSQKTTTGKNLLDTSLLPITKNGITISKNDNGDIVVNGTITGIESGFVSFYIGNVFNVEAGTYTSSLANKRDGIGLNTAGFGGYLNITMSDTIKTKTATATETQTINPQVNIRYDAGTFNNFILNPMLEKSSTATDYEPYTGGIASPNPSYPQDVHTINGDNTIISSGKNLFNKNTIIERSYVLNDGTLQTGTSYEYNTSDFIPVEPNTTYYKTLTLSPRTKFYDANKQVLNSSTYQDIAIGGNAGTFTTPANAYYLRLTINTNISTGVSLDSVMVHKGSEASTYQAYQSNSVLLALGDKEICWIGDYKDKIFKAIKGNEIYDSLSVEEKNALDYGKWYLRKATGKVVLNGTQNIPLASGTPRRFNATYTALGIDNVKSGTTAVDTQSNYRMCDHFGYTSGQTTWGNYYLHNNWLVLLDNESVMADANALKTWLANNPTTIYYVLETPTNELFNDAQQEQLEDIYNNMLSYEGQTNISQINNDLPFNINSSALKDLSSL